MSWVKPLEASICAGMLKWLGNPGNFRIITCSSEEHTGTLTWLSEVLELSGRERERERERERKRERVRDRKRQRETERERERDEGKKELESCVLSIVKFGQRLFTTYPHVSDYILLKTQMGNENRWQIEFLDVSAYTPSSESERILSLSEEGVYAETSEKFYLSSVLVLSIRCSLRWRVSATVCERREGGEDCCELHFRNGRRVRFGINQFGKSIFSALFVVFYACARSIFAKTQSRRR